MPLHCKRLQIMGFQNSAPSRKNIYNYHYTARYDLSCLHHYDTKIINSQIGLLRTDKMNGVNTNTGVTPSVWDTDRLSQINPPDDRFWSIAADTNSSQLVLWRYPTNMGWPTDSSYPLQRLTWPF